jgi:S-disulfanyl-L-cysteine oxidoreductase SoxD
MCKDYARNAHGNLAEQSRSFGSQRGADTTRASNAPTLKQNQSFAGAESAQVATNSGANSAQVVSAATKPATPAAPAAVATAPASLKLSDVNPLLQKYACAACHGVENKIVGPSFKEIVAKQGKRADAQAYLSGKIKGGGQGIYGQIPMPAQSLSEAEAAKIAQWLVQGAAK